MLSYILSGWTTQYSLEAVAIYLTKILLTSHDKDPNNDGKISQEATNALREEAGGLELLEPVGDDEDSKEENDRHKEDVVAMSTTVPNHLSASFAEKENPKYEFFVKKSPYMHSLRMSAGSAGSVE